MKKERTTSNTVVQRVVKDIKKIMIDRGINQRQLSQMACVSPSQLCHSFSGRRRFSFDLLTRIADALGFSITFSLEKKEDGKL